jgi:hypothetical protein
MVFAMVVLMVPVVLIVALYRFLGNETPPTVDPAPAYESAERAKLFDVARPANLPQDWHIASATYASGVLRVGFTLPGDATLQLVESNTAADTLAPTELGPGSKRDASFDVDGTAWDRWTSSHPGERAIVLATSGRTIIIAGKASDDDFRTLARSLK